MSGGPSDDVHGTLLGMSHLADVQPVERNAVGVVYNATDLKLERRVTVHVLKPMTGEMARIRFDHECKLLGRLSAHPNVITLYDAGFTSGDRPYLIMELVDGPDLAMLLDSRHRLPWEVATDIVLQICTGLEQAHRAGVLHRNISPSNILMAGTTPKLTGFGISAMAVRADPTGLVHRAPEAFGEVWSERTDLYSVASVLYQMIDGNAPFWRPGDAAPDAIRLRVSHERAPTLDPDLVPAPLGVFLSAALSKDPLDRPQTTDEFLHELGLIREGRTTGSIPSVLHGTTGPMAVPASFPAQQESETAGDVGSTWFDPAATGPPAVGAEAPIGGAEAGSDLLGWAPVVAGATTVSLDMAAGPRQARTAPPPASRRPPSTPIGPVGQAPDHGQSSPGGPTDGAEVGGLGAEADATAANPSRSVWSGPQPAQAIVGESVEPGRGAGSEATGRPTAFMLAMALIAVGTIGLAAVVAMSALDSGDTPDAAPVLSDPDEPTTIEAVGTDGSIAPTTVGDAMAEPTTETSITTTVPASTVSTTMPRTAVPMVVGEPVEVATRRLADAGFEVLIVGRKSVNAQPGTVIQQKPDGNDLVVLPFTVTVYIPKAASLPSMVGRSADAVCLELQALTLTCNRVQRHDAQIPAGTVIASQPVEGTEFVEGSSVEVAVSLGPVMTVAVPALAGSTRAEAETTLLTSGFVAVGFESEPSESVPVDQVIGSNPAAGTSLATDQTVTVLLSNGPPVKVQLPDVVGSTSADAEAALSGIGMNSSVVMVDVADGDPNIGLVLTMDPGAGAEVDAGSTVTITVGRPPAAPDGASTTTVTSAPPTTATSSTAG